jgi:hypothetical protein
MASSSGVFCCPSACSRAREDVQTNAPGLRPNARQTLRHVIDLSSHRRSPRLSGSFVAKKGICVAISASNGRSGCVKATQLIASFILSLLSFFSCRANPI